MDKEENNSELGFRISELGFVNINNFENQVVMVEDKQLLQKKSFVFAVRIVNLYKYLVEQKSEYVISKQMLRSGTSIGANLREAKRAQSTPDFHTKLTIALKEADETAYWLNYCVKQIS